MIPTLRRSTLAAAALSAVSVLTAATVSHTLTLQNSTTGKTPQYMGDNVNNAGPHVHSASNQEWLKNYGINAVRLWVVMDDFEVTNDSGSANYGDGVTSEALFNNRRSAVIANPTGNPYINWSTTGTGLSPFLPRFTSFLDPNAAFYDANGMTMVVTLKANGSWFDPNNNHMGDWADRWEWWEYCYAVARHCYQNWGVLTYEIGNEGNINGITGQEQVIMQEFARDAIDAAIGGISPGTTGQVMGPCVATVAGSPDTWQSFLNDSLNLSGVRTGATAGDGYLSDVSFHMYRKADSTDADWPGGNAPVKIQDYIKGQIIANDHDGQKENMWITESNTNLNPDPTDSHANALLAMFMIQLVNHAKIQGATDPWLRGLLKFRVAAGNIASDGTVSDDGSACLIESAVNNEWVNPPGTHYHKYWSTYTTIIKALKAQKSIVNWTTTTSLPADQLMVSKDSTYYYLLYSNLSSVDTHSIALNTSAVSALTNKAIYTITCNASNFGVRGKTVMSGSSFTWSVGPDTVSLLRIPIGTVKTLSSIALSPSSNFTLAHHNAKAFTATATYTDSTTADITDLVTWTSSNTTNGPMEKTGIVWSQNAGSTSINCTMPGTAISSSSVTVTTN